MIKRILNSRITYALLSIVFAIGIWSYVLFEVNPDESRTIYNIPVSFDGESILAERGLVITSVSPKTVNLTLEGNPRSFIGLTKDNITIAPSVSNITAPGEHSLTYEPVIATEYGKLSIVSRSTQYITIKVERLVSRSIEIQTNVTANAADGYQMGEISYTPGSIEIKGPVSDVNRVSHAVVNITGDDLTKTVTGELPFQLVGYEGDEALDGLNVTTNVDVIQVSIPVVVLKEVELKVRFVDGGGATAEHVKCTIDPQYIYVSGDESAIAGFDTLILGEIDLSKIINPETLQFPIELDSELQNESGITQATVTVEIDGLVTRAIDVTDIRLINAPDGFEATPVTQSRKVVIRGTQEQVDAVQEHQLWLVADLSNISAAEGTSTVQAKAYLNNNNGAGVVDAYYIVVSLER